MEDLWHGWRKEERGNKGWWDERKKNDKTVKFDINAYCE